MNPDFWHERWQRGETGWEQGEINAHLREVWPRLGVNPDTRVFVPLCGKTLDLLWLASQGHRVLGDSPRFRERGLTRLVEQVYRLDPQD